MNENIFGYLLITCRSIDNYDIIAQNYWTNTVAMNNENNRKNTGYSCCVVCLNLSWWQRKNLSAKTGIPMEKLINISSLQDKEGFLSLDELIWADSTIDSNFWGKIKIFDSSKNIARSEIISNVDVVYEACKK